MKKKISKFNYLYVKIITLIGDVEISMYLEIYFFTVEIMNSLRTRNAEFIHLLDLYIKYPFNNTFSEAYNFIIMSKGRKKCTVFKYFHRLNTHVELRWLTFDSFLCTYL